MTHIIYFKGSLLNIIGAIQVTVPNTQKIKSNEIEIKAVVRKIKRLDK